MLNPYVEMGKDLFYMTGFNELIRKGETRSLKAKYDDHYVFIDIVTVASQKRR